MNSTISLIAVLLASLASLTVCLGAARNFIKGWKAKIASDQKSADALDALKKRVEKLEQQQQRRRF